MARGPRPPRGLPARHQVPQPRGRRSRSRGRSRPGARHRPRGPGRRRDRSSPRGAPRRARRAGRGGPPRPGDRAVRAGQRTSRSRRATAAVPRDPVGGGRRAGHRGPHRGRRRSWAGPDGSRRRWRPQRWHQPGGRPRPRRRRRRYRSRPQYLATAERAGQRSQPRPCRRSDGRVRVGHGAVGSALRRPAWPAGCGASPCASVGSRRRRAGRRPRQRPRPGPHRPAAARTC